MTNHTCLHQSRPAVINALKERRLFAENPLVFSFSMNVRSFMVSENTVTSRSRSCLATGGYHC